MKTETYSIVGMHCVACKSAIEKVTRKLDGVSKSDVNLPMNILKISYDENLVDKEIIEAKIKKAGFSANLLDENDGISENSQNDVIFDNNFKNEKSKLIVSICVSSLLLYISMGQMIFDDLPMFEIFSMHSHPINFAIVQMLLNIIVIFLERKFFISGFTSLFNLTPNMDTLVAISASTSFLYSLVMVFLIDNNVHAVHELYFESSAIVLSLVSLGKYMEASSKEKTKNAIKNLIELTPLNALLVDENGEWEVPTKMLKIDDVVLVKAGQSIPLDGVLVKGAGNVNEAMITGESVPVKKEVDSFVIGGTILSSGAIYVKITQKPSDTTLFKIIKFVKEAQMKQAPISKLADKVASVFVPVIIVISLIAAVIWLLLGYEFSFALKIFTTILVIACPCSMGLATPTSIMVATGVGASNGILIRDGETLETTHKVSVAIFDKTGTITNGTPVVTSVFSKDISEDEFLNVLISVEKLSDHPLAKAICDLETSKNLEITPTNYEVENLDGLGIVATSEKFEQIVIGNMKLMEDFKIEFDKQFFVDKKFMETVIFVARDNLFLGYVTIFDEIKKEATDTIKQLKNMNIKTVMITGDNKNVADFVAKKVEIDEVYAEILPIDKALIVEKYKKDGSVLMFVGDGINDAPALVSADVGLAVGNGSDIAIDSAKIILMKNNLLDIKKAITLSRFTIKNIKQNLFWAFFYNCLCIPVAAGILYVPFGILLSPMIGGIAMSLSSIFVVSNALSLNLKKI